MENCLVPRDMVMVGVLEPFILLESEQQQLELEHGS